MAELDDRNDRTLFVGNLEKSCKEEILYELFLQAGPLSDVKIAKERDGTQKGYAFIEFKHDVSVPYALQLMNGISIYGRQLAIKFRKGSKHEQEQYQGPPVQAFPEGFPLPPGFGLPPDIQRTVPNYPLPKAQFLGQSNFGGQMDGYHQSPHSDFHGQHGQMSGHQSGHGRRSYDDARPSSRGPYRGTPPGSRDGSPRWEDHGRGERFQGRADFDNGSRSSERRFRDRPMEQGSHHGRMGRDRPRDDGRHRGRERSRTVDDHQRGHHVGHPSHHRDRSTEHYHRSRSGGRSGWSDDNRW